MSNKSKYLKTLSFIILFLLFFSYSLKSQDNSFFENRLLEGSLHYGFLWPHHSSIAYSINGHVPGFEINMLYQATGKHIWEEMFRYPRKGFGFSYLYLQDNDVFGSSLGF